MTCQWACIALNFHSSGKPHYSSGLRGTILSGKVEPFCCTYWCSTAFLFIKTSTAGGSSFTGYWTTFLIKLSTGVSWFMKCNKSYNGLHTWSAEMQKGNSISRRKSWLFFLSFYLYIEPQVFIYFNRAPIWFRGFDNTGARKLWFSGKTLNIKFVKQVFILKRMAGKWLKRPFL